MDERLLGLRKHLVVTAHPAMPTKPSEGALHHPAPGKDLETRSRRWFTTGWDPGPGRSPLRNLDRETQLLLGEGFEAAPVRLIDPEVFEPRIPPLDPADDELPPVGIVDVGGMHPHREDQPEGVYQEMPLAPVDSLSAVVAADPPFSVVLTD